MKELNMTEVSEVAGPEPARLVRRGVQVRVFQDPSAGSGAFRGFLGLVDRRVVGRPAVFCPAQRDGRVGRRLNLRATGPALR